ncbi:MAG: hypothetical protein QG639_256 [Patescibacteria group bacterium]|nr:hypothetical protein [Patescibacteria group bacterium]
MPANHQLFELRVGKDNQSSPEALVQICSALPSLRDSIFAQLFGQKERLSFEIWVEQQTIYFICYMPVRLVEYLKSLLTSSYPEIVMTPLAGDIMENFSEEHGAHIVTSRIGLANKDYFPLKTFRDFSESDPLSPLFSTLAQVSEGDTIVLQYLVNPESQSWKNPHTSTENPHPQQAMISKKTSLPSVKGTIQLVVASSSADRAHLLSESIGAAYQALTQNDGNRLYLQKTHWLTSFFLKAMAAREYFFGLSNHFSIDEMGSIFHLPTTQQKVIPNIAWGKRLLGEPPDNLPIVTSDQPDEIKRNINPFARTIYKNQSCVYGLARPDRRRHFYVIGKTGTGKSTLLANMAIGDMKNNEGMCVIDPHGDLVETLLNYIPSRRINDVIYFDPSDKQRTVQINLFEGENVAHRELIASGIVSVFKKLYGYSWGPRLEYILRNALLTLLKSETAKMSNITDLLTDERFRIRVVEKLEDPILKSFWLNEFNAMQERQRNEAVAPILNKVGQFVSSPIIRDVVNADKSSFSIEEAMNSGKIILVNLSQGRLGEDNATLLGAMMITKIQLAAMARVNTPEEERRDFFLYVDEFQNFATDSFTKILSEARKYRLNLTLANQYIAQIPEEVQKSIFGNCGSMASFVMGADDAAFFTKEYNNKYTADDLVTLGRHKIINKIAIDNQISDPFPAETLPLAKSSNSNKDKVIRVSRERYARAKS